MRYDEFFDVDYTKVSRSYLTNKLKTTEDKDERIRCKRELLRRRGESLHSQCLYYENFIPKIDKYEGCIKAHKF